LSFGVSVASFGASVIVSGLLLVHWKKTINHRLLFYLTTSDVLSMLFEIMSLIIPTTHANCPTLIAIYVYFLMYACAWTCIIGFHILWTSLGRLQSFNLECIYVAISVCIPLPYLLWLLLENDIQPIFRGDVLNCYFNLNSNAIVFGWPIMRIGFFCFNVLILGAIVIRVYNAKSWSPELRKSKARTLFFIQICFLLYTISSVAGLGKDLSPLRVEITTVFTQLQGLLNSMVVGRRFILKLFLKMRNYHKNSKRISQMEYGDVMLQNIRSADSNTPPEVTVGHATIVLSDNC